MRLVASVRLSVRPSVRLSVRLSPLSRLRVKVRGWISGAQRSIVSYLAHSGRSSAIWHTAVDLRECPLTTGGGLKFKTVCLSVRPGERDRQTDTQTE